MPGLKLEQELDHLYSLPLAEFIAARNELAKKLRAGGDRDTAAEVKKLAKPSVTAWAVNALYHQERPLFDELLAAAAAVRAALAGKGDRRAAEAARRKALRTLLGRAVAILGEAGRAATPSNRQRVSHTLEALAARDPAVEEPRLGRLDADLEPQGFDILAGLAASLAPAAVATPARPRTKGDRAGQGSKASAAAAPDRRLAAARREVAERQADLARLENDIEQAEAAREETAARHEGLLEEAAEAERRARDAVEAAAAARHVLAAAKAAATKTKAARRRALSRLATARRRLERLDRA